MPASFQLKILETRFWSVNYDPDLRVKAERVPLTSQWTSGTFLPTSRPSVRLSKVCIKTVSGKKGDGWRGLFLGFWNIWFVGVYLRREGSGCLLQDSPSPLDPV